MVPGFMHGKRSVLKPLPSSPPPPSKARIQLKQTRKRGTMTAPKRTSSGGGRGRSARAAALLLVLAASCDSGCGHGAMTFPRPRNAVDGHLHPWANWSYPCDSSHQGDMCEISFCRGGKGCQGACPLPSHSGLKGALNASNGQACYWFSNGCTVGKCFVQLPRPPVRCPVAVIRDCFRWLCCAGCDSCDGTHSLFGHSSQRFLYRRNNRTDANPWNPPPGDMVLDPNSPSFRVAPNCAHPSSKPTICDPRLRTLNTQAACGSPEDIYYWSPWRAPGNAPVIDACGAAGGRFPGQGIGDGGAQFQNSSVAQQGDIGSRLPPMPPQATWKRGASAEVAWNLVAHHVSGFHPTCPPRPIQADAQKALPESA
jgi:hypothetical protein